ncbi:MAG: hypothetical protein QM820_16255 [Minicystis sp.]
MAEPLGKVTDREALDACDRGWARLRVEVEAAWLSEGAELEITAPGRLPCARCDGGGCDACGRSGVLRAPEDTAARVIEVSVPAQQEGSEGVALRIPDPFGVDHAIGQLHVELRAAASASPSVRRIEAEPPPPAAPALPPLRLHPLAIAVLVTFAGIVAALLAR